MEEERGPLARRRRTELATELAITRHNKTVALVGQAACAGFHGWGKLEAVSLASVGFRAHCWSWCVEAGWIRSQLLPRVEDSWPTCQRTQRPNATGSWSVMSHLSQDPETTQSHQSRMKCAWTLLQLIRFSWKMDLRSASPRASRGIGSYLKHHLFGAMQHQAHLSTNDEAVCEASKQRLAIGKGQSKRQAPGRLPHNAVLEDACTQSSV